VIRHRACELAQPTEVSQGGVWILNHWASFEIHSHTDSVYSLYHLPVPISSGNMEKVEESPLDLDWLQTREIAIQQAIESRDLAGLRAWSKEAGGFGSDAIRRRVW
jgi:hypothetical protein